MITGAKTDDGSVEALRKGLTIVVFLHDADSLGLTCLLVVRRWQSCGPILR
jgi:hypothetical protein